jgi:signal transduction histidine kinase
VRVQVHGEEPLAFVLPEAESIPVALTLNELLTNAVKHGGPADVQCALRCAAATVTVQMRNAGRLREGFSLAQFPGGVSGLGLVRALLPRRSAGFTLSQSGDEVLAEVVLNAPSVQRQPD